MNKTLNELMQKFIIELKNDNNLNNNISVKIYENKDLLIANIKTEGESNLRLEYEIENNQYIFDQTILLHYLLENKTFKELINKYNLNAYVNNIKEKINSNDYLEGSFNSKYYISDIISNLNEIKEFLNDNQYTINNEYRFSNLDGKAYINNNIINFELDHNTYQIELLDKNFKIFDSNKLIYERDNNTNNIINNNIIINFLDDLDAIKTDIDMEKDNGLEM